MKKTLRRDRKGNISIMVAFILALVSLLAILSASYVRDIIETSSALNHYYKAYYLAKAGIETSLVAIDEYGIGFEEEITSGNIINENFGCRNINCYFKTKITSRTHYNENQKTFQSDNDIEDICNDENNIILKRGEIYSIPLFFDPSNWNGVHPYETLLSTNLDLIIKNKGDNDLYALSISLGEDASQDINRHILTLTGKLSNISINNFIHTLNITHLNTGENVSNNKLVYTYGNQTNIILPISETFNNFNNYLLISNIAKKSDPETSKFCIEIRNVDSEIPRSTIVATSQGKYSNYVVGLQANKKIELPDFLFSTILKR